MYKLARGTTPCIIVSVPEPTNCEACRYHRTTLNDNTPCKPIGTVCSVFEASCDALILLIFNLNFSFPPSPYTCCQKSRNSDFFFSSAPSYWGELLILILRRKKTKTVRNRWCQPERRETTKSRCEVSNSFLSGRSTIFFFSASALCTAVCRHQGNSCHKLKSEIKQFYAQSLYDLTSEFIWNVLKSPLQHCWEHFIWLREFLYADLCDDSNTSPRSTRSKPINSPN